MAHACLSMNSFLALTYLILMQSPVNDITYRSFPTVTLLSMHRRRNCLSSIFLATFGPPSAPPPPNAPQTWTSSTRYFRDHPNGLFNYEIETSAFEGLRRKLEECATLCNGFCSYLLRLARRTPYFGWVSNARLFFSFEDAVRISRRSLFIFSCENLSGTITKRLVKNSNHA